MAEQTNDIEQQVETIILAGFAQQPGDEQGTSPEDERQATEEKRVIDVDLYRLEGGAVLLVPNNGTNPLDTNAVESTAIPADTDTVPPITPAPVEVQQEDQPQEQEAEPVAPARKRVKPSYILVPLALIFL